MRRKGQGHHLAITVLELEGQPKLDELKAAAAMLGNRHPILHSKLRRSPRTFVAAWHPSEPQAIPVHAHDPQDLDPLIHRLLNGNSIDILADGPNLHFHTVPLNAGRWALLILWPHALLDGIGINRFVAELAGNPPGPAHGDTSTINGTPATLWKQAEPVLKEMRSFPEHRIRSLHRKGSKPTTSHFEVIRFNSSESAVIRSKMASTAGELLLLPYFACCASRAVRSVISHRHPEEDAPILLTLPVQRQPNPSRRPLFHNHMVAYSLLLTGEQLEELAPATKTLYRSYASFLRRKLPAAMEPLTKLMERCPSRFYLKPASLYLKGEVCSLFHSHTGQFAPGTSSLFGSRLFNGYHVPTVSSPPGIGIFFSEFDGQLSCTISWKEGSLSQTELPLLRDTLLRDLGTHHPQ
ncbi:hypothetical protein ACFQY0_15520 [Haloferula chungangensis]|uniref:Condensation domain-containing protein n=1 Tax=Haloferula chungangensis TaxID=1048331 RepID=A0ABW2LA10_9BACT